MNGDPKKEEKQMLKFTEEEQKAWIGRRDKSCYIEYDLSEQPHIICNHKADDLLLMHDLVGIIDFTHAYLKAIIKEYKSTRTKMSQIDKQIANLLKQREIRPSLPTKELGNIKVEVGILETRLDDLDYNLSVCEKLHEAQFVINRVARTKLDYLQAGEREKV